VTAASDEETKLRADVIATALAMEARGINSGKAGNVSARASGAMLITPSSVAYDELSVDDIVMMGPSGDIEVSTDRQPSSEWRFHLDVYAARPDAMAIVHAHPVNATALACHGRGIESFHYMVAVAGGHDIRCADYATFGTAELSANVVAALDGRRACLMANHGILAIGSNLAKALDLAVEIEVLASQYLAALALGEPTQLTRIQMDDVLNKMSDGPGYGST